MLFLCITRASAHISSKTESPVPWSLTIRWISEAADAMEYLHDIQVIHGDIRIENVFLNGDLHAKVCSSRIIPLAIGDDLKVALLWFSSYRKTYRIALVNYRSRDIVYTVWIRIVKG